MPSAPVVSRFTLGQGEAGVWDTARVMAQIIRESATTWTVRQYALQMITGPQDAGSWRRDLTAIKALLAGSTLFVRDPENTELLQHPVWVLDQVSSGERVGLDCDDLTMLSLSLAKSVGYPVRLKLAALPEYGRQLSHVYGEIWAGGQWIALDGTRPLMPLGWEPASTRVAYFNI